MLVTESSTRDDVNPIPSATQVTNPFNEYWHSDGQIARVVIATLERNAVLPEGAVWVRVSNGWVTLKGQVDWSSQRAAAKVLARCIPGVRGVTDSLSVTPYLTAGRA
jgi:osmotically-inducible protein OsmY